MPPGGAAKAGRPDGLPAFVFWLFVWLEGRADGILRAAGIVGADADLLGVAGVTVRVIGAVGYIADNFDRFAVLGVLIHLFSHLSLCPGVNDSVDI